MFLILYSLIEQYSLIVFKLYCCSLVVRSFFDICYCLFTVTNSCTALLFSFLWGNVVLWDCPTLLYVVLFLLNLFFCIDIVIFHEYGKIILVIFLMTHHGVLTNSFVSSSIIYLFEHSDFFVSVFYIFHLSIDISISTILKNGFFLLFCLI